MVVETSVEMQAPSKGKASPMNHARKQGTNLGHSSKKVAARPEMVPIVSRQFGVHSSLYIVYIHKRPGMRC